MKEYTVVYTLEVTDIIVSETPLRELTPEIIANYEKQCAWDLEVDNVKMKGIPKIFEREVEE